MNHQEIDSLNNKLLDASAEQIVQTMVDLFKDDIRLASSLGLEDQVLTHMVLNARPSTPIFILDTGRLNQETYEVMQRTMSTYKMTYEVYFPKSESVESMISKKGPNSFYDSIENRKECCNIRKVEPLSRALSECKAWFTGLRRAQSITRQQLPVVEWDSDHNIVKVNPLAMWSQTDVTDYISAHSIPYNVLHDKGFPSIGCEPCTRAIEPGDDIRSGRWWWETPDQKECGLHVSKLKKDS